MTCPFGSCGGNNNNNSSSSRNGSSGDNAPLSCRRPNLDADPASASASLEDDRRAFNIIQTGVVRERVSAFSNLKKAEEGGVPSRTTPNEKGRGGLKCCRRVRRGGKGSEGEDDDDDDEEPVFPTLRQVPVRSRPLTLHSLNEAVWNFITVPSDHILHALDSGLKKGDEEWNKLRRKLKIVAESVSQLDDFHLDDLLSTLAKQLDTPLDTFMDLLGHEYVRECRKYYEKPLFSLGRDVQGFFANLISVCDILLLKANSTNHHQQQQQHLKTKTGGEDIPNLLLMNLRGDTTVLHFFTNRRPFQAFIKGVISGVSEQIFEQKIVIKSEKWKGSRGEDGLTSFHSRKRRYHYKYTIIKRSEGDGRVESPPPSLPPTTEGEEEEEGGGEIDQTSRGRPPRVSPPAAGLESRISVKSFCSAFPWHFVCDKRMRCLQMGSGLAQVFGEKLLGGEKGMIHECLKIMSPEGVTLDYDSISKRLSSPFILAFKSESVVRAKVQDMELKGQMIEESGSLLLFVGSPLLDGMEGLTSHGLFLSDIPIHDATRDVILVGEQARAQHEVKRRMAQLKDSILEANKAVDQERERNVSLLHTIFPPDVAKRLWLGEAIEAQTHNEVTMLFSDIVGFTSICSTASPLVVIDMLQNLYTKFDAYCGFLDIYKVETIGDAYCVAGNLHRRSRHHAQRVTWMALCMMDTCSSHKTHYGEPLKMRIGIHTGPVLAGVVGTTMPRFCLFGSNVTIANSFESTSQPLKIHISPTTKRLLNSTPTFVLTELDREHLPKTFPREIEGCPSYVEGYFHPRLSSKAPLQEHIEKAVADLYNFSQ